MVEKKKNRSVKRYEVDVELKTDSHEVEYAKLKTKQQIEYEESWKAESVEL